jgi:hypothetical protein
MAGAALRAAQDLEVRPDPVAPQAKGAAEGSDHRATALRQ